MITIAHFYNEIINHYDISAQEKLGGGKLRKIKTRTRLANNQGSVMGGGGTKREAIDLHFRWYVLAELVRRTRGKTYMSQHLHSLSQRCSLAVFY